MKKINYKDRCDQLAYAIYRMIEGDDGGGAELLEAFGYTDENGEWKYEEDDE